MFPLGDDNSNRRSTPFVLYLIIGLNCFVWYLQLTLGEGFTMGFSAIPFEITKGIDLVRPQLMSIDGQSISIPQAPGPHPLLLTIFSAMFMHGSWGHIAGNMVYLFIFGDQIEDLLGHVRFAVFYLLCGIGASAAHILFNPTSIIPSLGASGAIAGVLGAYLISFPHNQVRVLVYNRLTYLPAVVVLGGWIITQFASQITVFAGAQSGVAYLAHIGGFLAGIILLKLFGRPRPQNDY